MAETADAQEEERRVTLTVIESVTLEDVRNAAGMRQEDVAELARVNQPTISRLESGSWPRTRKRVRLYADAYGLSERDFLAALLAQHDRCAARDSNPEPAGLWPSRLAPAATKLVFRGRLSTAPRPSRPARVTAAAA